MKRRPLSALVQLSASIGSTAWVAWLMRTSLAWIRRAIVLVVLSAAVWRLKVFGSVRTDATISPPRGTALLAAPGSGGAAPLHPLRSAVNRSVTTVVDAERRSCPVESWLSGQETGRSKLRAES